MARVVLVSRNPVMAMGLSDADTDVTEVRPSHLQDWLDSDGDVGFDALVLDLGSADTATAVVDDLRARNHWVPVLLIANASPEWQGDTITALPRTAVLASPVTGARLSAGLVTALALGSSQPLPEPTPPTVDELTARAAEVLLDPVPDLEAIEEPTWLGADVRDPVLEPEPLPGPERAPEPEPPVVAEPVPELVPEPEPLVVAEPVPELVPEPEPLVVAEPVPEPEALPEPLPVAEPVPVPEPEPTDLRRELLSVPEPAPVWPAPGELVAALLPLRDQLYGLAETADVVVADALTRLRVDGAALMVPDGDAWRVAAGHGLRPLEVRYQLTADSWLVQRVAEDSRGVIVEGSDIARHALRGAPLASRRHLLAVPVPMVGAILVLARDDDPSFDETDLAQLAALAREAGPLLQEAINLRTLARVLEPMQDNE